MNILGVQDRLPLSQLLRPVAGREHSPRQHVNKQVWMLAQ